MSTPSQIRSQWNTSVWSHADITAITEKIYSYDIVQRSQFESSKWYYEGKINFFTYLCTRGEDPEDTMTNQVQYEHQVEVSYYKEADAAGAAYNSAIDSMVTVYDTVESELAGNWNSLINYYRRQAEPPTPELIELDGRQVWKITAIFTGFDRTTI